MNKKERRRARSHDELRALILVRAQEMIEANGLPALTVRDLADSVGYTCGMLYYVFNSLDEIVSGVERCFLNQLLLHLSNSLVSRAPRERLDSFVRTYFRFAKDHPHLWALLAVPRLQSSTPKEFDDVLECVAEALRPMLPRTEQESLQQSAKVFWCLLHGAVSVCQTQRLDGILGVDQLDVAGEFLSIYSDHLTRIMHEAGRGQGLSGGRT